MRKSEGRSIIIVSLDYDNAVLDIDVTFRVYKKDEVES